MNIGFDASRAFIKNKTGTENYSYQLLKHLLEIDQTNNYCVYLQDLRRVTPRRGLAALPQAMLLRAEEAPRDTEEAGPGVKYINIPLPRLWTQLGLATRTFIDPLDVLFIPSHTLPIIRRPSLRTILTVHDLGAEYLPQAHQLKQQLYLKFMTHQQLQSASQIIAVSKATKTDLIKKVGIEPSKISVIYEGVDPELLKPVSDADLRSILKAFDIEKNSYFLFVGTIQPRKNLARLIEAYARFLVRGDSKERSHDTPAAQLLQARKDREIPRRQDPELILVGSKGWLSDEIYQLPAKLGIQDKVRFLGYVTDQQKAALFKGAQAFLFPSLFEGFGLPVLEAFAQDCPVLTSNSSSLPEVAGKAAILVDPNSIEEITQGIITLNQSSTQRSKLVTAGRQQLKKFSWQKAAQETLNLLNLS